MAKFMYEHVASSAGFSGETWDVAKGHDESFSSVAGDAAFLVTANTITLTIGTWPVWFVPGKVFVVSGTTSNNGTFSVKTRVSGNVIEVREALATEVPVGVTVFDGNADTEIQDVLLKTGNGVLTTDAPLVLTSTGVLGGARTLSIAALESENVVQGSEALRGRLLILSVQNTDIISNPITLSGSTSINGSPTLVISSTGDYMLYHTKGGVWRTVILPLPSEQLATIKRIPFLASDWDAGATKNRIKVLQTGSPLAGEIGPHGIAAYNSYLVQVVNTDLTPDEQVDVEIQFAANGDITLVKAAKGPDFAGVVVISGTLD